MGDRTFKKLAEVGQVQSFPTAQIASPTQAVADAHSRTYIVPLTDGGTAGTAVTETAFLRVPFDARVVRCDLVTPVAVTASDTLYATVTLAQRDSNGVNSATVATQTTKTSGGSGGLGSLTAFKSTPIPITAANQAVAVGAHLTAAVAKASTGTPIAAATSSACLVVVLEEV